MQFANKEAHEIHAICENDPCLGEACLTRLILNRSKEILDELEELEK